MHPKGHTFLKTPSIIVIVGNAVEVAVLAQIADEHFTGWLAFIKVFRDYEHLFAYIRNAFINTDPCHKKLLIG